ncbi:MAG: hypothetical protein GY906_08145 [bacterium]|nr:hypothetical protein [bacterium]
MTDRVLNAFLDRQQEDGATLARQSDLLNLLPLAGSPTQRYVATFNCRGLVRDSGGEVRESDHFEVGIWFPPDYLRRAEPFQVLTWCGPRHVFHPNISATAPFICIGRLTPGTSLVDILYQSYEVITYQKVTMREDDALNKEACAWARRNQHRLPIDRRSLKRRTGRIHVDHATETEQEDES